MIAWVVPGRSGDAVGTIRAKRARSAASSATSRLREKLRRATGGRVYIFVNSRRIREFLPRLRPAQIELHNFSSLADQLLRPRLARDELIPLSTKGDPRL